MLLDLHVHTSRYSRSCSILQPAEIAPRIKAAGLDGFCITEHDLGWSQGELDSLRDDPAADGLVILAGREVVCQEGHVLVFGLQGRPPANLPAGRLVELVHQAGGACVLAHPFRYGRGLEEEPERLRELWSLFDAVEALTPSHLPAENRRALELVRELGLPAAAGSDAHSVESLGHWATSFPEPFSDLAGLIEALRAGRCSPLKT